MRTLELEITSEGDGPSIRQVSALAGGGHYRRLMVLLALTPQMLRANTYTVRQELVGELPATVDG
jgi:hypothetical protein